ncbi:MAG TPA: hypothetical protein VNS19_12805 [Acidimicrobiales bacterium]|nr:hypothetical protein [Acidimicrobiales bacterium]
MRPVVSAAGAAMILLGMVAVLGMVTERRSEHEGLRPLLLTGVVVGAMAGVVLLLVDSLDGGAQLALAALALVFVVLAGCVVVRTPGPRVRRSGRRRDGSRVSG